jgi:DNA polymerase-3 subunit delta
LITLNIEENIGFSKDFNVFELRKAIGERNQLKAYTIAENFANNGGLVTTSLVLVFLLYHGLKTKKKNAAVESILIFKKEYDVALKNYPMKRSDSGFFAGYRCKSKGVGQAYVKF